MAEVAIPLLALGSLYLISNLDKNNNKTNKTNETNENFTNMGAKMNKNYLPNTHIPNINFPTEVTIPGQVNRSTPVDPTSQNYVHQYLNPNQTTDKFFDLNNLSSNKNITTTTQIAHIDSLSGNKIDKKEFNHNNMVPFFGSKVRGRNVNDNNAESILDNTQGAGTNSKNKVEQAPLFKPEDNMQWSHGAPNNTDFIQSRQLPSQKIANVLPWEQEKVGPGLGLGYTTNGQGGFNSGMLDRNAWTAPTVDELRVKTNPKITYGLQGHEGPAVYGIKKPELHGTIEKNRPDTDFNLGPDKWFTTTGIASGQKIYPQEVLPESHRSTTSNEYFGVGGNDGSSKPSYMKGHYQESMKQQLSAEEMNPVAASGRGNVSDSDYGANGYTLTKNNRQMNCQENNNGNISGLNGAFKAILAPIIDVLRPTRKQNVIGNPNQSGNVTALVPNLPITNPTEKLKPTIKETTGSKIGLNHLNVSQMAPDGAYKNIEHQFKDQERNKTDSSTMGFVGGPSTVDRPMNIGAWQNQHNNVNKTYESWPMPGGTSMFNSNENIEIARRESDMNNIRQPCDGPIIRKQVGQINTIPSLDSYGKINMPQQYDQQMNSDRMNPDILSAFKSNPYAQSLNSY